MTGGLPCTPFTGLRNQTGTTAKTGRVVDHPAYQTFKSELLEYLKLRSPHFFWIEEVTQVTKINPKTGFTYLEDLAAECTNLGYSVRATFLDHVSWIDVPRERCFMIGIKDTAGGSIAAEWCTQKLVAVTAKRTAFGGPSLVWDILPLHDEHESMRIHREGQDTQQM